jgi:hypothetical protein
MAVGVPNANPEIDEIASVVEAVTSVFVVGADVVTVGFV